MLNFISTVIPATATLNFTNDLSILLSGLVGLAWFSAGMIALAALREAFAHPASPEPRMTKKAEEYRLAA